MQILLKAKLPNYLAEALSVGGVDYSFLDVLFLAYVAIHSIDPQTQDITPGNSRVAEAWRQRTAQI